MASPRPTKEELIAAGWKKATPEQIAAAKAKISATGIVTALVGEWCYSSPCADDGLTCYIDESGACEDCYYDPLCD